MTKSLPSTGRSFPDRPLPILLLIAVCMICGGCIHLEQEIRINPDGSAAVSYHYSVPETDLPALATGRRIIDEWQGCEVAGGENWFTNRTAVENHFAANGAELQVYRNYSRAGRRHVELVVFTHNAAEGLNSGLFGTFELLETPDGSVLFRATPPLLSQEPATDDVTAAIKALAGDLRIVFSVRTPRPIVSSTAPEVHDQVARWVFDAAENDAFLTRIPPVHVIYQGLHAVE